MVTARRDRVKPGLLLALCLSFVLLWFPQSALTQEELHEVELIPDEVASWSLGNVFSFLRPGYYYGERVLEVETSPPGGVVDLYYVRATFQKEYEQAQSPVRILLPRRIDASRRDVVTIRAIIDGYAQKEISVPMMSRTKRVVVELDPLPNTLLRVAHTSFAGRSSLVLYTEEALEVRLQKRDDGFTLILNQTAFDPSAINAASDLDGELFDSFKHQQLGEDLMLRLSFSEYAERNEFELRSRTRHDPILDRYQYVVDFINPKAPQGEVEKAKRALGRIQPTAVRGCALRFEDSLRSALDPAALNRALVTKGEYTDPYTVAAVRRLGELQGGSVRLRDGTRYRPANQLELAAAMSQPAELIGLLALLRAWTQEMHHGDAADVALRSLIAPEKGNSDFAFALKAAIQARRNCR